MPKSDGKTTEYTEYTERGEATGGSCPQITRITRIEKGKVRGAEEFVGNFVANPARSTAKTDPRRHFKLRQLLEGKV